MQKHQALYKFTIEDLKKLDPCEEGLYWYLQNIKSENLHKILIQLNNHEPQWARWLFTNIMNKKQCVEIAVYSAELALHIFEERYPNDDRPRKAIEAAKKYLASNNNADADYATAYDAANAAAADASYAAAYATVYAAYAAAYAAAAADAACTYDCAAANAVAYATYTTYTAAHTTCAADAAKKETQENIINKAVSILMR